MPNEVKQLLEKYNITPNKVLGQNFLTDKNAVSALIKSVNIAKEDIILEIGPGTGAITKELAKKARQVIAIEKDENMVNILQKELEESKNVHIVQKDILKTEIKELFESLEIEIQNSGYKVVSAPPYYLTGRLFRHFLENSEIKPEAIALIIQKEVAQKICAIPPDMNLLAISVQLYGKPKIIQKVSKNAFWPKPEVDSAILTVANIRQPSINEKLFFKLLRAGFSSPRKQLSGNLSREFNVSKQKTEQLLKSVHINPKKRAQALQIEEWITLLEKAPGLLYNNK